jgi:uncharacterized protein (DUF2147 family)
MSTHIRTLASILLSTALFAAGSAFAQQARPAAETGVLGRWLTHTGNVEIEIAPCGEALCGTVVKVLANRSMSRPGEESPAESRATVGMAILKNFVASGKGEWEGEIYDRESAKTYSCRISLQAKDELTVRPYVLLTLFGKTLVWTRVASQEGRK